MLHEDRRRAMSFGADPGLYDRTRPSYPDALVDRLLADGAGDVLDVGCGTGIVSRLFLARGCRVLGIEPDDRMAAYARQSGLAVEAGRLEAWDPAGRSFDLLVAGQAWHWVDPEAGAVKATEVLGPGGRIGLFWNWAMHPPEVGEAFAAIYSRLAPGLDGHSIVLGMGADDRFGLAAAGLAKAGFERIEQAEFRWPATYTAAHWHDHLLTHSDHQTMDPTDRERLLAALDQLIENQLGGSFTTTYRTVLVTGVSPRS
ncbi:MAG TPA: class I SAM-dependent methyltransferase [Acidimicrobiales bacterium]|nr:class I SAM-dependent methyltransferase [Acidimicrobiales bacterium]